MFRLAAKRDDALIQMIAFIVLLTIVLSSFYGNRILLWWYVQRIERTTIGAVILDIHDDIITISPDVISYLYSYFENEHTGDKARHAVTFGIIHANPDGVSEFFYNFLDKGNSSQIAESIFALAELENKSALEQISKHYNSDYSNIRASVAGYLALFHDRNSLVILRKMVDDEDEYVQHCVQEALAKRNKK